jgi:hypothetical protein
MLKMLYSYNRFKVIGAGDKIVLITDGEDGQTGYVINNPFFDSMTMHDYSTFEHDMWGGRNLIPGRRTSEIILKAGEIETVTGPDLEKLYDPVMQKSVLDLMKIVNVKIMHRK